MTFIGVAVGAGRARLRLDGGNLAPRVLSSDDTGARVALVSTTALLLGGDEVDIGLEVGRGAWLEIVETAGMVAYDAHGATSDWRLRATVDDDALLLWHGEPFVVADGADTLRGSHFEIGARSKVCVRETVVLGRTGESGGALRVRNWIGSANGPLLMEELDLTERATRELPGIVGTARVVDTVMLVGAPRAAESALPTGSAFELAGATGTIGRVLRTELAGSPIGQCWTNWSAAARAAYRAGG